MKKPVVEIMPEIDDGDQDRKPKKPGAKKIK